MINKFEPFQFPDDIDLNRMSMDRRHVYWMYDFLLSGKCRRVLELGSAYGCSTMAFVEALSAKQVDEVHLCDPNPQPSLLDIIKGHKNIHLHTTKSSQLFNGPFKIKGDFDFVLIDANHNLESVKADWSYVSSSKAIMAHDTSALAVGVKYCEGTAWLKNELQSTPGFYCIEDNMPREGERTDRGTLFGTRDLALLEIGRASFTRFCH